MVLEKSHYSTHYSIREQSCSSAWGLGAAGPKGWPLAPTPRPSAVDPVENGKMGMEGRELVGD